MTTDLTTGKPLRLILTFTLPLLAGLVLQQLYHLADAVVVGRTLGIQALAAVGATGSIAFLLLGFTMGMTNGFAIPVARAFGAGDADAVRRSVAVGAVLSAIVAAGLTLVGIPLSRQLLIWMATPAELLDGATIFMAVTFAGCSAGIAFNYLSGIIRALGDSRTPLMFLAVSSVLNVGLVLLLVGGTSMGIAGAALATVLAQLATVVACLALIARRMPLLRPRRADWRLRRADVVESLRLGLPMGFQMSIIAIGTLVLQYAINRLGPDAVAAFAAASRVDALAMTPYQAFGMAIATYVAQNRGAGQWSRIRQGVTQTAWLSVGVALAVGLACILWGTSMVRVFAGHDAHAEAILADAHTLLLVNGLLYFTLGLLFVFRSALQGLGHAGIPTFSGVVELVLRSAAALVLVTPLGFLGAVLAAPLAWVGALVPLWISWEARRRALTPLPDEPPLGAFPGGVTPAELAESDQTRS
ncbi:MATE family efflux transporter [Serinibacter arcticus]|uniref:MATE family efflux transporter n=1 Tax=Serinibacter arcticus TaxID=1655435 RepID=UPI001304DEEF|nr:MATE family efflux transporter [Serinibacter arcticus]